MTITDPQRRAEAQRLLLAEILGQAQAQAQADAQAQAQALAREKERILNAARQQAQERPPITDPVQRRAAQQRAITQILGPRPQAQPQAQPQPQQNAGMNSQTREFFESQSLRAREKQRLLDAQVRRGSQPPTAPQFNPAEDDRIARKLNAIAKRSDVSVSQVNGAIEIRTRGRMRDEVIRAYLGSNTVSSSTARYR